MPKPVVDNSLGGKPNDPNVYSRVITSFTCRFHFGLRENVPGYGIFENVIDIVCPSPPHKLLLEWLLLLCTQAELPKTGQQDPSFGSFEQSCRPVQFDLGAKLG
jgi:hypothetical protein